jgi:rhodanese-related sulfurtransferase
MIICLQALYSHGGYTILDIRPNTEVDKYGKIPPSPNRPPEGGKTMCVPYMNSRKWFENGAVQVEMSPNPDFMNEVRARFRPETKLLVMDFDGQEYAIDALDQLYDAGYEEIAGLQGGYKNWFRTWDNKLKRRNLGEYQEHSWGEGETSCGIHASGAGFENQDAQSADFWKSF